MKLAIEALIHLLHSAHYGTLATQSTQLPGYPYATVLPSLLDAEHRPLLLVSALAEHTKNLLADRRVAWSVLAAGASDVQNAARLTLVGDAEAFSPEPALLARVLRYQPAAEQHLGLDFMFFRIQPRRIRYIAGVGSMGWFEAADWSALPALDPAEESALLHAAAAGIPARLAVLGADRFGIDYLEDGERQRRHFSGGPESNIGIAASLAGLA
jgi:heme iron utilization protein